VFRYRSLKEIKKKLKRKRRPILAFSLVAGLLLTAAPDLASKDGFAPISGSAWPAAAGNEAMLTAQTQEAGGAAGMNPTFRSLNADGANDNVGLKPGGLISLLVDAPHRENVVRTFFQLDIRSLEARMSPEMPAGSSADIRVTGSRCMAVCSFR